MEILIPTLEEHAYHLGWISYFNKSPHVVIRNPYLGESEKELNKCWEDGWKSAEIVAKSIADL